MATFFWETGDEQGWKAAVCNLKIFIRFPLVILEVGGSLEVSGSCKKSTDEDE